MGDPALVNLGASWDGFVWRGFKMIIWYPHDNLQVQNTEVKSGK